VPKAFVALAGRPMVEWSEDALRTAGLSWVRVVPQGFEGVPGGATRSQSVLNGLAALPPDCDVVVVHDAARPLVPHALFGATVEALKEADCAVAAARVTDTVKVAGADGAVVETLDRSRLWAIQTPQAFRRAALERALDCDAAMLARATDDAWLVEQAGGRVRIVESTPENFKVTTPHDLKVAGLLLAERQA
jgi:2-C-methyl-D-erythritol 4-phosphate cytidylyltransferase